MSRRQKPPHRRPHNPAYRQTFERLDAALEENTPSDNSEMIQRMGKHIFGDLWDKLEQAKPDVIPE